MKVQRFLLPLLETDLAEISNAIVNESLSEIKIEWKQASAACVVLASKGYPQKPAVGDKIYGIQEAMKLEDVIIFHAGTAKNEKGEYITAGGRVLGVTAIAENLSGAVEKAYDAVSKIYFEGMQFRKDIGR